MYSPLSTNDSLGLYNGLEEIIADFSTSFIITVFFGLVVSHVLDQSMRWVKIGICGAGTCAFSFFFFWPFAELEKLAVNGDEEGADGAGIEVDDNCDDVEDTDVSIAKGGFGEDAALPSGIAADLCRGGTGGGIALRCSSVLHFRAARIPFKILEMSLNDGLD